MGARKLRSSFPESTETQSVSLGIKAIVEDLSGYKRFVL